MNVFNFNTPQYGILSLFYTNSRTVQMSEIRELTKSPWLIIDIEEERSESPVHFFYYLSSFFDTI